MAPIHPPRYNPPRMVRPAPLVAIACCLAVVPPLATQAADPQAYTVSIAPTGDAALDAALTGTSNLVSLRERAPVGPFALVARARDDKARLETALGSFGYYAPTVSIQVAGRPLDDPTLPDKLERASGSVPVTVSVTRGPEFHLRRIDLVGTTDPAALAEARAVLDLKPGDPARAAAVVAAQGRILDALRAHGRALAKVATPDATLDPGAQALDVSYRIDAGPRVDLGPIMITGLDQVNESFVRQRLLIHQGEPFNPAEIEKARQDLAQLGVFATVNATEAPGLDAAHELPITIAVTERPRRAVNLNLAYSTDLGATAGVTWTHRNLFGNAESLRLGAAITQLGGTASRGSGYDINATFTKPDFWARDQSLSVTLQAIQESLDAYNRTAVVGGVQLARKFSPEWTGTAGVQAQQARITQEGITRDYTLLGLPVSASYDTTGPDGLLNPTHGVKATVIATPTESFTTSSQYVVLRGSASTYVNLADTPGRSVIALRGTLGVIEGANTFQIPPDQRFYAGGSGTVRGYRYQSVGPRFPDNRPVGGTALAAATVEYRQRFGESYGVAVFVDAGEVTAGSTPFSNSRSGGGTFGGIPISGTNGIRAGAGIGARYYTAIGPIRADFAVPLNKGRGDDTFEIYIGIGENF